MPATGRKTRRRLSAITRKAMREKKRRKRGRVMEVADVAPSARRLYRRRPAGDFQNRHRAGGDTAAGPAALRWAAALRSASRHPPVSDSVDGFDRGERRIGFFELAAEALDVRVDGAVADVGVVRVALF